jgi:hypothetical protein
VKETRDRSPDDCSDRTATIDKASSSGSALFRAKVHRGSAADQRIWRVQEQSKEKKTPAHTHVVAGSLFIAKKAEQEETYY